MASMHGLTMRLRQFPRFSGLLVAMLLVSGCVGGGDDDGQTTLNWDAPLTRVDGSKLYPGEIQGYRVYYRRPGEAGFRVHAINDASKTEWQPTHHLPAGDYVFAVSTMDTSGLESARSETLRVTIP